jgi:hypothetical protein
MNALPWLLLMHSLPAKSGAVRLFLWRQLKRLGAVSFKTSVAVLPDRPELVESLQWLAQRVRQQGGEATLVHARQIDGISDPEIVALFQQARTADYEEILADARLGGRTEGAKVEKAAGVELEKLAARYQTVRQVDFFDCPAATRVERLLEQLRRSLQPSAAPNLNKVDYHQRVWLTRPRPEVDRVGSAWLIQRFIDPQASFVFDTNPAAHPGALPYDMVGVEFGHQGEDCTFETMVKRFNLNDLGLSRLAEIIHDADLGDGRYGTQEGVGLLALFRGWARMGWSDTEILARGFDCFDALHCQLRTSAETRLPMPC